MRRTLAAMVALLLVGAASPAAAGIVDRTASCPTGDVPLFAGAGTPLSNGFFFPGTAVYAGGTFQGVPLVVPQGCDVRFVNLDVAVLTNGHEIVSFGRKHGRPLFQSALSNGPKVETVRTSKLAPGLYPYYCVIHYGMYGVLQVAAG